MMLASGDAEVNGAADKTEVMEALFELQQYLSDQLPPLLFADSMAFLLYQPPELAAAEIQSWVGWQYRGKQAVSVPISDYLFHALRKIYALGEFKLLASDAVASYLQNLAGAVMEYCPAEDRDLLRANLARLGESVAGPAPKVEILYRQPDSAVASPASAPLASAGAAQVPMPVPGEVLTTDVARGLRRLTLLLERLGREPQLASSPDAEAPAVEPNTELVSQVVAAAATSAGTGKELDQHLEHLRQMGVASRTDEIFTALGNSLPGWAVPSPAAAGTAPVSLASSGPAEAMHKIISLAESAEEVANRIREMVHAAVKQFNEGLLTRAATMFELAGRALEENKVSPQVADAMRSSAHEYLNVDRLRKFSESPDKHALLRTVLSFFKRLTPEGLLADLRFEERRDRRRLMLSLLVTHGAPAREAALERLRALMEGPEGEADPFFLRNLIYLLRFIPRPPDAPVEPEVELIAQAARPNKMATLVKEAIATLGKIKHESAERVLIDYLKGFERVLLRATTKGNNREHFMVLLDRTVSALAHLGTRNGVRATLVHGLRTEPELGEAKARLAELGSQDLSGDPEVVGRLVAVLRAELPGRGVGKVAQKKSDAIGHLVSALSGTSSPDAQAVLTEVASRFPSETFGQAASKAVKDLAGAAPPPPSASLSGDLEVFELPNLLQNMASIQAAGVLTLFGTDGQMAGVLTFEEGKLRSCQAGILRGREALYQLFQKPFPGTFAFVSHRDAAVNAPSDTPLEVMPLILEAIRRYDEFRRAAALVPDEAVLKTVGLQPPAFAEEANEALVESVWERVVAGSTPAQCEAEMPVDSYRIRRLLAHWVEQGALYLA